MRRFLPLAAVLAFLWPAHALAIGFGIEGGGAFTQASGLPDGAATSAWTPTGGIIVENTFDIAVIFLDLWADVQTPLQLQTGGDVAAKYVPIDLGLRVGLAIGPIQPYVGILGQLAINTDSGDGPALNSPIWGLGGDLGLDIALFVFRFGVELRAVETLTQIVADSGGAEVNEGNAFEFEALASVRLSF
jgi:hypothetical protein